ncbi:MAG TPA: hypothetical protein VHV56_03840 [Pseudolabrys sp.]|jgi:hypothetical protein|nr:hypothetical protein [Pseudolabrys sp.]
MANPLPPGIPAEFWDDYIKRYESEIDDLRKQLAPLENGEMQLRANGRDVNQHWISFLRHTIQNYQSIIEAVKRGELR